MSMSQETVYIKLIDTATWRCPAHATPPFDHVTALPLQPRRVSCCASTVQCTWIRLRSRTLRHRVYSSLGTRLRSGCAWGTGSRGPNDVGTTCTRRSRSGVGSEGGGYKCIKLY